MALATAENIRDRLYTLLEALTPATDSTVKFRRYRNEWGADFVEAAEKNPAACLRRFQVRQVGGNEMPETSSTIEERIRLILEIRIAYPQSHRYGNQNAMDRDDVIRQDMLKLNASVGLYGRGNFSGSHDCTPLGATPERETATGVDFLVVTAEYEYLRSIT